MGGAGQGGHHSRWGWGGDRAGLGMSCPIPNPPTVNRHTPVKPLPSVSSGMQSVEKLSYLQLALNLGPFPHIFLTELT